MDGVDVTEEQPGELVRRLMEEKGWSQVELAFVLGATTNAVSQMLNSKKPITAEMAKLLGLVFGQRPERFAEAQARWALHLATEPGQDVEERAHAQTNFPLREMVRRGWIKDPGKRGSANAELCRFFGVNTLDSISTLAHAAKKTAGSEVTGAQIVWLHRVRSLAKEMIAGRYAKAALEKAVQQMATLRGAPEEIRHVPRLLSEAGVRFVVVEGLPGGKIDGVCTWLDDRTPVIGMSLRFDRIDNFWFVLRHECAHVLHGHGKKVSIIDSDVGMSEEDIDEEEKVANEEAQDFCVPKAKMRSFYLRKNPLFTDIDVQAFAKLNQVHPGLVVGQLQYMTKQFGMFRNHLVNIRKFIMSSALVDGWGNTVTVSQ